MRNDEYHLSEVMEVFKNVTSGMWLRSMTLKYVSIHVDTRRGNICWLKDRHGERILLEDIKEAIEQTPDYSKEEVTYPYNTKEAWEDANGTTSKQDEKRS